MLHMSNSLSVGDISLFSNDTVVLWGLNQDRQTDFLDLIRQQQPTLNVIETKEVVEYTTDEDEVTDMKGDIMILNPYWFINHAWCWLYHQ
ncbi:hypothetical protein RMCBS344292_17275 [Rhizopus microsporus]|nr:hypothetical protein RMCBS344292_17275 [Rhizopus microsporus]